MKWKFRGVSECELVDADDRLPVRCDGIMLAGACILDAVPTGDEPVLDVCRRTYGRLFAKKKFRY